MHEVSRLEDGIVILAGAFYYQPGLSAKLIRDTVACLIQSGRPWLLPWQQVYRCQRRCVRCGVKFLRDADIIFDSYRRHISK